MPTNHALEPAHPHGRASGAVWRGSRREPSGSLARSREKYTRASLSRVPPRTARQTLLAASLNDRLAAHARSAQHNSTAATSPQTRSGLRLSAALAGQMKTN